MRLSILLLLAGCSAAPSEPEAKRPLNTATPSAIWFKGEVYCPPGTVYEGTVCKPLVVLDCAAGTKFKEAVGCVPLQPQPEPSSGGPSFSNQVPSPPAQPCQCAPGDLACALRCQQRSPKFEPPPPAVPQGSSFDRR